MSVKVEDMKIILVVLLVGLVERCWGTGMLMDPVNRGSMWRFDNSTPMNPNDDKNNCGGSREDCGICGDPIGEARPRDNENTGKYGTGKIARTYQSGSVITARVLLTHNQLGQFYFSVCKLDDRTKPEPDEDCFKPIKLTTGEDFYKIKYSDVDSGYLNIDVKLPENLVCEQCVLRWHYRTASSWGKCDDGTYKAGCGPQEILRTCSDIAIQTCQCHF